MSDLLPANSTPCERAISAATDRAGQIPTPAALMWDPARIPAEMLPWLAWAVSVDHWDPAWPEARQRAAIAGAADWHRNKGTRASALALLAMLGHPDARVIEDRDLPRYGRGWVYGRGWRYGPGDPHWADYWIEVMTPIDRRAADLLAERLRHVAPARCRLRSIRLAGLRYAYGDGLWTYGPAVTLGGIYPYGE